MAVPDPARVDFCVENVALLGLAQQEALDAPSDKLVAYVLLDGEAVLGGNHALVEAELLVGAVVSAKEREHSVEHGPEGDEAVAFHDFPETGGVCDEVVPAPCQQLLYRGLIMQVCLGAQEPPEIRVEEQLEEGKCGALMVDVVWDILGANVVSMELYVDPGDSL